MIGCVGAESSLRGKGGDRTSESSPRDLSRMRSPFIVRRLEWQQQKTPAPVGVRQPEFVDRKSSAPHPSICGAKAEGTRSTQRRDMRHADAFIMCLCEHVTIKSLNFSDAVILLSHTYLSAKSSVLQCKGAVHVSVTRGSNFYRRCGYVSVWRTLRSDDGPHLRLAGSRTSFVGMSYECGSMCVLSHLKPLARVSAERGTVSTHH